MSADSNNTPVDPAAPTLEEFRQARLELQRDITLLLRKFESTYGLQVTGVRVRSFDIHGPNAGARIDGVEVMVDI